MCVCIVLCCVAGRVDFARTVCGCFELRSLTVLLASGCVGPRGQFELRGLCTTPPSACCFSLLFFHARRPLFTLCHASWCRFVLLMEATALDRSSAIAAARPCLAMPRSRCRPVLSCPVLHSAPLQPTASLAVVAAPPLRSPLTPSSLSPAAGRTLFACGAVAVRSVSIAQPLQRAMLVLFETPAGYALFKVQSDIKAANADDVWKQFTTPEKAAQASAHSRTNKLSRHACRHPPAIRLQPALSQALTPRPLCVASLVSCQCPPEGIQQV